MKDLESKYLSIIITVFIFPALYELLKYVVIRIGGFFTKVNIGLSLSGGWLCDVNSGDFNAIELLIIKQKGHELALEIFQYTNYSKLFRYKGKGTIKGAKIVAYYLSTSNNSDHAGTYNFNVSGDKLHSFALVGCYTEQSRIGGLHNSNVNYSYKKISLLDKFLLKINPNTVMQNYYNIESKRLIGFLPDEVDF